MKPIKATLRNRSFNSNEYPMFLSTLFNYGIPKMKCMHECWVHNFTKLFTSGKNSTRIMHWIKWCYKVINAASLYCSYPLSSILFCLVAKLKLWRCFMLGRFGYELHLWLRPLLWRPPGYKIGTAALTAPNKREGCQAVLSGATKIPF
jgi:hypothetical protein